MLCVFSRRDDFLCSFCISLHNTGSFVITSLYPFKRINKDPSIRKNTTKDLKNMFKKLGSTFETNERRCPFLIPRQVCSFDTKIPLPFLRKKGLTMYLIIKTNDLFGMKICLLKIVFDQT